MAGDAEKPIKITVDEYKDRARMIFSGDVSYLLLHPKDGIRVGEALIDISKKILTTPPKGVKPN